MIQERTRRAMLISGGNAKGAVQVRVLDTYDPADFDFKVGTSVGGVNGAEWAARKMHVLHAMYPTVNGLSWYLRLRWPWEWFGKYGAGVFSLDRLRGRMLKVGTTPQDTIGAFHFGVYDYEDDVHRLVSPTDHDEWLDARMASATIPIVMHGWDVVVNGARDFHRCLDGGMRFVLPDLPGWNAYDEIVAVLASPVNQRNALPRSKVNGLFELIGRTIDIWIDGSMALDLERLQRYADAGIKVVLHAPRDAGASFDASHGTMMKRLEEGRWMANNPFVLRKNGNVFHDYAAWLEELEATGETK
jgi:predicted patatin/cPLA2 family phospholipase